LGLVMMLLGMVAGLMLGFFLPMAVARYLVERRVEAAFNPVAVWSRISKVLAEHVAAYLLSIGSFIVAGLVGNIPFLGVLAWPFLSFTSWSPVRACLEESALGPHKRDRAGARARTRPPRMAP